jgi:uncharacterized protein (DUF983 family)
MKHANKLKPVDGLLCLDCAKGLMFFVRFWLDREIRQCDVCGARYSFETKDKE